MIYTQCPHCGATLSVPDEFKRDPRLHCNVCGKDFDNTGNIPSSAAPHPEASSRPLARHSSVWMKAAGTLVAVGLALWGYDSCVGMEDNTHYAVANSQWDGSVSQVEKYIKSHLRDPESYQSMRWGSVKMQKDGSYRVSHKFKARNANGEEVVCQVIFFLDAEGRVTGTRNIDKQ